MYGQMLGLEPKAASKIYALLTPQQRAKADQLPHPPIAPIASILGPLPVLSADGGVTFGVH
jgi:hypothetical protein